MLISTLKCGFTLKNPDLSAQHMVGNLPFQWPLFVIQLLARGEAVACATWVSSPCAGGREFGQVPQLTGEGFEQLMRLGEW